MKNVGLLTGVALLAACSAELPHEAPFDSNAPLEKQAKASLTGTIRLEGETDFSQVTLDLQNESRTYNVDTAADGAVSLTGIVPGEYALKIRTRYFQAVTETLTVDLAEKLDLGTRTLAPLRGRVLGLATSERVQGTNLVSNGGVQLALRKTASIRSVVSAAPGIRLAADAATAVTLRTVSGIDGSFEFNEVPAGGYTLYATSTETGERAVGSVTVTGEGDLTVDPIVLRPLTGYFEILGTANGVPSSTFTSVAAVNLQLQQSNAVQVKVAVSTDGTTATCDLSTSTPEALPSNTLRPLTFASEGKKLVCVSYIDTDGKETEPIYGSITYDATPPTLPSLAINGGAQVVSSNLVTLSISAVDTLSGVAVHKVHGVNDFSAVSPKPYQPTDVYSWVDGGDGLKTLWVVFGDHAGNYSAPVSASVLLDTTPPAVSGGVTLTKLDGTPLTSGDTIAEGRVKITSTVNEATPMLEMQITTTGSYASQSWVPYDPAKTIDLPSGASTISVRVRDGAGHVVDLVTAFTLTTDTTPPTGALVIAPTAVTDPAITVQATGSVDAVAVELAFDPGFVTSLGNFVPGPISVTLPAGDGTKTVYGRFFDAAGNTSSLVGDTVVLDTTPPQILFFTLAQASPTTDNPVTVQYSASGAAELRISEGDACGGVREPVGAGTRSFMVSASEGDKEIRLQLFDAAGNASECAVRTIYFDPTPPVIGALQINFGQAATSSNIVTLSFPGVSGATKVMVGEDAGFSGADWQSFSATKTFTLSPGNGVKTVYGKVADDAGHVVNLTQQTITLDTTPPSAPSIFAAVEVTSQTSVQLSLAAGLVSEMWITQDDPGFSTGAWETYSGSKLFTLSGADGTKTIYAKFKKSTGLETGVVSDTVILDRAAPTLPSVQINGGAAVVTSNIVTLNLSAVDAASGLSTYKVNTVNDFASVSPKPFQPTDVFSFAAGDGPKTVWVTIGDKAGLYSTPVSATVLLDTTAPAVGGAVTMTKLDGTPLTTGDTLTETRVVLSSSVSDASSLLMQVTTNGSYSGAAWVPYEPNKIIDLSSGASSISARVRDGAGLVTELITAFTLTIDTTPPTGTLDIAPTAVTDPAITVQATGSADAVAVELAFDPGFVTSLGSFVPGPIAVTLPLGDGVKTVYARFFDAAGNASALEGDTVTLDTTPPQILSYNISQSSPTKDNPVTVSYSTSGAAELRITEGAACGGAREPVGAGSKSFMVSASEGNKEISLQFFDAAGNASECALRTVYFDPNPPGVGALQINFGQAATSSNVVTLGFPGVSGATKVMVSEDAGFAGADWQSFAATKTFTLSAGNGVKTVYAKVADDAANTSNLPSASITLDTTPPTSPSVFAAYDVTSQTSVLLTLSAGLVSEMWLTQNDPSFTTGAWEVYSGSKVFALTGADGTKTIYAKFKKSTGVETAVVSDTVLLDRAAPILPNVQINGGALVVGTGVVTLSLSAVDTTSGLATYQVNTVNDFSAVSPKPYQPTDVFSFAPGDGPKTVWVVFGDRAGHYSAPVSASIIVDTAAPALGGAVTLTKVDGTTLTTGDAIAVSRIVLNSSVSDSSSLQMQVTTNGSYSGVAWVPYEPSKMIDLVTGSSSISARVRDGAGLITDLVTAFTLTVDTTPPTGSLVIAPTAVTSPALTVQATGSADAVDVELAFDPGFVTSLGFFTPGPIAINLQPGDGVKTVYARFFDAAGNASTLVGDTVTLDTTPPQILSYTLAQASPTKDNPVTVNYSVAGAAELRVTEGLDCGGAREPVGTGTKSFTVSAAEGVKEIRLQFFDAAGNASECAVRAITYDPNPPVVGTMQLNYGQAATSSNVVTVSFAGVSGATKVMVSEDPVFSGVLWDGYASTKTFVLSAGNGVKTVYAKVADDAGHVVNVPQATITLDTSTPIAPAIYAAVDVTTQTSVLLTLAAGVVQDMWLTQDDPNFTTGAWEPYVGSKVFTLSGADGIKTIYAKFRKSTGVETPVVSDTVILDRAAPTLPSVRVDGNASVVSSAAVVLNLSAVDASSGLATYKINTVNDFTAVSADPFQSNVLYGLSGPDGLKTIWVTIGDKAGIYSAPVSTTVTLDTSAPVVNTAVVQTTGGTPLTTGSTIAATRVVLVTNVSDLSALQMQVSTTGSFAGAVWEAYNSSKSIDLPAGPSTLVARVRDAAGHITDLLTSFSITVDNTPPSSPVLTINGKIAGAVSTTTVSVTLSVSADAVDAEIAYDPGFVTSLGSFAPNATHNVPLLSGDGSKSLYVRFFDAAGNESSLAGDTVILDTTPPIASYTIAEAGPTKTNPLTLHYTQAGATSFRVAEDAACGGALEAVGSGTKAFTVTGSEGAKEIRMQFFDAVGNASACLVQSVYYDPNPPVIGSLQINYGQAATSSNVVTLSFPGVSGATKVMVSEDAGFAGADWQAFAATKTFVLSAGNGVKTVYAKVADDAGHVVNLTQQSITLDTTPPTAPSIFAAYDVTSQTSVTLFLSAGLVSEMWITQDDPTFTTGAWETYSGSKLFALSGTDGTKTIYAKFKKSTGVETAVVSDTIILDRTAPILPSLQINGGASVVTSNIVTLNLSAVDSASGLYTYKVNETNDFSALSPKPYQTSDVYALSGGDGEKTVWVTYGDRAGHYSTPVSKTVLLDTTSPSIVSAALQLGDASSIANGQTIRESRVYLATSVSDLTPLEMQITTNGSFTGIAWEPYAATKVIDLALPAGQTPELRNVQARVRDGAGHVVSLINIDMLLDTRAPTGTLTLTSPALTNNATVSLSLSANEAPSEAQLSTDPSFGGATWFATVNTAYTLPAGDGIRTVYARFRDGAGNLSNSVTVSLTLDQTSPALPSVSINNGAAATSLASGAVNLALSAVDSGSAVTHMKVANLVSGVCADALSPVAEEGYAASKAWTLDDAGSGKEGTRWVCAALRDGAGNWSAPVSDAIAYDTAPPAVFAGGILINGGDLYTTQTYAELALSATGATEMMLANGLSFGGSAWESYRNLTSWFLAPSDSPVERIVSVKFRDAAGNETAMYSDAITLDTGAPSSPAISINAGAPYATTTSVDVNLFAVGADTVRLSNDPLFMPYTEQAYASVVTGWPLSSGDGTKTVYAQFFDEAGNASSIVSEHLILDTQPPSGADFIIEDAPVTPLLSVYLTLTASDAVQMQISEGGCVGTWVSFSPNASYSFQSSLDGEKYISVRFRDQAGNMTACITKSITLDQTWPYISSIAPRSGDEGKTVVINGQNFGTVAGTVTIGGLNCTISGAWTNSQVSVIVPTNVDPGTQELVLTAGGKQAKAVKFNVLMILSSLSRVRGEPGQSITFSGKGFGATGTLYFNNVSVPTTSWTRTSVVAPVPGLPPGSYIVQLGSHDAFTVTDSFIIRPVFSALAPLTAPAGATFTLTGSGFGAAQGNGQVTVGPLPVTVTSWTDTSISALAPYGLMPGAWPIEVEVNGARSLPKSFTVENTKPRIQMVTPSLGITGKSVTFIGDNFGSTPGTVTYINTVTTPTAWFPNVITFTVPSLLPQNAGVASIQDAGSTTSNVFSVMTRGRGTWSWSGYMHNLTPRDSLAAVWTGTELIVAGGWDGTMWQYDGARYNPVLHSWAPIPYEVHINQIGATPKAVWMGSEMFIWGGTYSLRFNPATNAWTRLTGEPAFYSGGALVWTGSKAIVWGGQYTNTGYIYDPQANTWTAMSTAGAPSARRDMAYAWSGTDLFIWGGNTASGSVADGFRYNPAEDKWSPLPASPLSARSKALAAWAGGEFIIYGGILSDGARYNPVTNVWKTLPTTGSPGARSTDNASAIWSGKEFLVWNANTAGARYNPETNTWASLAASGGSRYSAATIWTGSRLLVWGGNNSFGTRYATGASYDPDSNTWVALEAAPAPPTFSNLDKRAVVAGGPELFVWSGCPTATGCGKSNAGERFDVVTNRVRAMNTTGAPQARIDANGIWTGSKAVFWGGYGFSTLNSGGIYDPATDSWTATSTGANVPAARDNFDMFWDPVSGVAIVYGGYDLNSGGLFDPVTNTWQTMNMAGGPAPRHDYSVAWTGEYMIIYGGIEGGYGGTTVNTGFKYALSATGGSWSPIASSIYLNHHRAVWTGDAMYVVGGYTGGDGTDNGSCWREHNTLYKYDLLADAWSSTSNQGIRSGNPLVAWNGKYILMYGGRGWNDTTSQCGYNTLARLVNPVAGTWSAPATWMQPPGYVYPMVPIEGEYVIPWGTPWHRYLPVE